MASKDNHKPPAPPVKGFPGQKHSPSPSASQPPRPPQQPPGSPPKPSDPAPRPGQPAHSGSAPRDPVLGDVEPLRRETETLPVAAHPGPDRDEPVGHARHAETPEEVEKISAMEGFGASSNRRVPPPGSPHYVAGQPVDDEEWEKTEREANASLKRQGAAQRSREADR